MSDILAKLRAAHGARKMVKVHVPEYDLDLYFPPLTLADHERIRKGINAKDEHTLMVSGLIRHARDKTGEMAFPDEPEVWAELHRMEFGVLARIMAQSSGGPGEAVQAELGALDGAGVGALRDSLSRALGDAPQLKAAVDAASDGLILSTLADLAIVHARSEPVKNG